MRPKSKEQGDIYEYSRLNNEKIIKIYFDKRNGRK